MKVDSKEIFILLPLCYELRVASLRVAILKPVTRNPQLVTQRSKEE